MTPPPCVETLFHRCDDLTPTEGEAPVTYGSYVANTPSHQSFSQVKLYIPVRTSDIDGNVHPASAHNYLAFAGKTKGDLYSLNFSANYVLTSAGSYDVPENGVSLISGGGTLDWAFSVATETWSFTGKITLCHQHPNEVTSS